MPIPTKENPSIVYVKKASQWVKTYFTDDGKGKFKQIQEWSQEKPNAKTDSDNN